MEKNAVGCLRQGNGVIWGIFSFYQARAKHPLTTMAEMEVSPQDDVVNPQDIKVFAVERHGRPRDFVYSRSLCGMQSWPLVFAPNHKFGYGPLQVQAPEDTFCFASVLS